MNWLLTLALFASAGSCLYLALSAHRSAQLTFSRTTRVALQGISLTTLTAGTLLIVLTVWIIFAFGQYAFI